MGYQEIHLAREQMRRGHKVVILTSNILGGSGPIITGKGTGKEKTKACRQIEHGLDVYRLPGSFVLGRVWLGNIEKALDELKPDVIHCYAVMQYYSVCVALYKKKHKSVRVIYDSHNIQSVIKKGLFDKIGRWFGKIIFKAISSEDACYAGITSASCRLMIESYGIPKDKVYMIPLGSDHRHYYPDLQLRKGFRKKLKLDDKDILILNTGKIRPDKRVDVLIRAVALARKRVPKIKMIQVGGGSKQDFEILKKTIEDEKVADIVFLHPAVEHLKLADYFRAADICVWPGVVTMSMIDASGSGVPLVVTRSEGIEYQVSNNNATVCSENAAPEEIADAIIDLCLNEAKRKEMGIRGRELVERYLNWEYITDKFQVLYEGRLEEENVKDIIYDENKTYGK
jgi:glycosyltransferase involved in cell wall biosynthesis